MLYSLDQTKPPPASDTRDTRRCRHGCPTGRGRDAEDWVAVDFCSGGGQDEPDAGLAIDSQLGRGLVVEPAAGLAIHSFSQSGELETGPEEYSARPRPQPVRLAPLLGGDAEEVGRKE